MKVPNRSSNATIGAGIGRGSRKRRRRMRTEVSLADLGCVVLIYVYGTGLQIVGGVHHRYEYRDGVLTEIATGAGFAWKDQVASHRPADRRWTELLPPRVGCSGLQKQYDLLADAVLQHVEELLVSDGGIALL